MSADGLFLGVDVGADDILCIIVGTGIGGGVITAGWVDEIAPEVHAPGMIGAAALAREVPAGGGAP